MSREDVDIVRATFTAICRRDYRGAAARLRDDAVWHNTAEFPGPNVCVGPQAIADFWEALTDSFEGETSVEALTEGDEGVLVDAHTVGRGRSGRVPLDLRWSLVFRVCSGKVGRVDVFGERAKAIRAAGLEE